MSATTELDLLDSMMSINLSSNRDQSPQTTTVFGDKYYDDDDDDDDEEEEEEEGTREREQLLNLIDKFSSKRSVIRKLRNFLAAVQSFSSVSNIISIMTDAVRCITWESLFPYVEDLFRDENYATLIRSTATFTFCHIQLCIPDASEEYWQVGAEVAKAHWIKAMRQLMTTYQIPFMDDSLKVCLYLDQLKKPLEAATQKVPETERVQLFTILRPDYCLRRDFGIGASTIKIHDATYQVNMTLDPHSRLQQLTDLTMVAMGLSIMEERTEAQSRYIMEWKRCFSMEVCKANLIMTRLF
jgi:hypothetical protein